MEEIIKGNKFLCYNEVLMEHSDLPAYKFGCIYYSSLDGCITDEQLDVNHKWTLEQADDYFIKIKHKQ